MDDASGVRIHLNKSWEWRKTRLTLQLRQVTVLAAVALGRAFDKSQEMAKAFAFGGFEIGESDANTERWSAARDHSIQNNAFDPELSVCQPQTDSHAGAGRNRSCSFDETTAHAGIRQVAPDRVGGTIHAQLHCNETLQSRIAPPILPGRSGSEDIRFKRWRGRWAGRGWRRWFGSLFSGVAACCRVLCSFLRTFIACVVASLDFAHGSQQRLVTFFRRSFAIGLQEFTQMAYQIGIRKKLGPIRARCRFGVTHRRDTRPRILVYLKELRVKQDLSEDKMTLVTLVSNHQKITDEPEGH